MAHVSLLACCAGILASAAAPHFSWALSLRSGIATSQQNNLGTNLFVSSQNSVQTAPTADDKTEGCLAVINALRTGNLGDLLKTLTKADDSEVTESLKKIPVDGDSNPTAKTIAVELAGAEAATCNLGENASAKKYPGLVVPFAHNTDFDCNALIQATYTAGLRHLKQSNFDPSTNKYNVAEAPFDNVAASNVAFLLSAKSTKVSCAATTDCQAGHDVLFCYFIQPLQTGDMPFTTELYNALWGVETGAAPISVPSGGAALLSLFFILLTEA